MFRSSDFRAPALPVVPEMKEDGTALWGWMLVAYLEGEGGNVAPLYYVHQSLAFSAAGSDVVG